MSTDNSRTGTSPAATFVEMAAQEMRPVFIGGCDRSGTTLLGSVLGAHSTALCVPEMPFKLGLGKALEREGGSVPGALNWMTNNWRFQIWGLRLDPENFVPEAESTSGIIKGVIKEYGKQQGKPDPAVWLDHTPRNIQDCQALVELFPDAKIIHIVRDGRAVASSLMGLDWGPNQIEKAAHYWVERLAHGFAAELHWGPERVMRVRYEDLVRDPESTLESICRYLGTSYEPEMTHGTGFKTPKYTESQHSLVGSAPNPSRMNAWREELTPRQIEIFESIASDLLGYLGYPLLYGMEARRISSKERLVSNSQDVCRKVINLGRARRRIRLGLSQR